MANQSMKEIIRTLSEYQNDALDRGIDFDLNIYFNSQRVPTAEVKLYYSFAGDTSLETHLFTTTFTDSSNDHTHKGKLEKVRQFVYNTTLDSNID